MSNIDNWIDFPTETGYWWRRVGKGKPLFYIVVNKPLANGDDYIMAIRPEKESYIVLDAVCRGVLWQKVKPYTLKGGN